MDPVEQLLAIEEIRQLKARYFRFVDVQDWKALATVFAKDVVFERTYGRSVQDPWTGEWTPPLEAVPVFVCGLDEVIAMVREAVGELITVHHGHMPEISFRSRDQADAIWAMSDELRDRSGRLVLAGRGHYHDNYLLTEQGWRIAASRLTRLSLFRPKANIGG